MTDRGMFVLFDLGETLVDLTDLVGRIADRLRREIPGMEQDAEKTSHDWIRRTSASLPREEGTPFVREIDVAATVLRELLAARGIPITESDADALLRRAWNDFEPSARFCPGVSREWLEELRRMASGLAVVTDGDFVNVHRLVKQLARLIWRLYISNSSFVLVASSGFLSSRHRPVNRGNRIARPAPGRTLSHAAVWTGLTVISAPRTSNTASGSNHASASSLESTRGGRRSRCEPFNLSGRWRNVSSSKPVPSLHVVRKTSACSS